MESGGVSFIVRVRNEESLLEGALLSLKGLTIPHDIVVVCHLCTDGSRAVAERAAQAGQPIRIFEYAVPVSRAGYETLVTPADHAASSITYCNWCYEKARYKWKFKWDADFFASPELLHFLNTSLDLYEALPVEYGIGVILTPTITNTEVYLTNCFHTFTKHIFWEVMHMPSTPTRKVIDATIMSIPPTVLKDYWRAAPWFLNDETTVIVDIDAESLSLIRQRFAALNAVCGPEPVGLARASNPEFDPVWQTLLKHKTELQTHGIQFWS